jgi:hypothetical protein
MSFLRDKFIFLVKIVYNKIVVKKITMHKGKIGCFFDELDIAKLSC